MPICASLHARSDKSFPIQIPFGIGLMLVFIALLNYLTDAYETYAASAAAASSFCRSIFGALLPLAAKPMYNTLGIAWASSLLGFLSLVMTAVPFVFWRYGDRIRANSRFCNELKAKKEKARIARAEKVGRNHEENAAKS